MFSNDRLGMARRGAFPELAQASRKGKDPSAHQTEAVLEYSQVGARAQSPETDVAPDEAIEDCK